MTPKARSRGTTTLHVCVGVLFAGMRARFDGKELGFSATGSQQSHPYLQTVICEKCATESNKTPEAVKQKQSLLTQITRDIHYMQVTGVKKECQLCSLAVNVNWWFLEIGTGASQHWFVGHLNCEMAIQKTTQNPIKYFQVTPASLSGHNRSFIMLFSQRKCCANKPPKGQYQHCLKLLTE